MTTAWRVSEGVIRFMCKRRCFVHVQAKLSHLRLQSSSPGCYHPLAPQSSCSGASEGVIFMCKRRRDLHAQGLKRRCDVQVQAKV